jgi:hypothetical protein
MTVAISIVTQKDYLETEATISSKSDIGEVSDLLKALKTNCKMIVLYNGGAVQAINIEMHTKMLKEQSDKVRELLGITTVAI